MIFIFTLFFFKGIFDSEEKDNSIPTQKTSVGAYIHLRGVFSSSEFNPVKANIHGRIVELAEHAEVVKKGDSVLRLNTENIAEVIERNSLDYMKAQIEEEILKAKYDFTEFKEKKQIEVFKAELKHAETERIIELSKPDSEEIELLDIDIKNAEYDLSEAQDKCQRKKKLFDMDFISKTVLKSYKNKVYNSKIYLAELKIKKTIRMQGLDEERKIELQKTVEKAQNLVNTSKNRMKRRLEMVKKQIVTASMRMKEKKFHLDYNKKEIKNAVSKAPSNGIFKIRSYKSWRTGGKTRLLQLGEEKWAHDIVADIINPNKMEIEFVVNQADLHYLRKGMKAEIKIPALPTVEMNGKITHLGGIGKDRQKIDPTAGAGKDSNVIVYNAQIELQKTNPALKPGMSAEITIPLNP